MKKITTVLTSLLLVWAVVLPYRVNAQSCPWAKKAGGNNEDFGVSVATDASGNVYYLGNFYSQSIVVGSTTLQNQPYLASNYGAEMYLAKYDSCGTFKWVKKAGGKSETYGTGVTTDAAGNVYVTGYSSADTAFFGSNYILNSGSKDAFMVKYNSNGAVQWLKSGTGAASDLSYAIAVDASNNVYLTGSFVSGTLTFGSNTITNGTNDGYIADVFITKYDNNGNNLWLRGTTSNTSSSDNAEGFAIGTDAAGNVYAGGRFGSAYIRFGTDSIATAGSRDMFVVKYDGTGNFGWLKTAGTGNDDAVYGLTSDASGNVYITGAIGGGTASFGTHSVTNSGVNRAIFIAKYGTTGTDLWAKSPRGDHYSDNFGTSVSLDAAGNAFITGAFSSDSLNVGPATIFNTSYTNLSGGGDVYYDAFAAKYKSNGILSWARSAGGDSSDIGNGIATGPNGALYLTGEYKSPTFTVAGIPLSLSPSSLAGDGDAFICNNIATLPLTPQICLVSADTMWSNKQYNVVYWNKTPYTSVGNFVIYREVTSGVYKQIGSQPYSALSMFIDTVRSVGPANGDPAVSTYRYKIQIMDTAGTFSYLSPYHNTVFFQNNSGTFNWNQYTVESMTITPVTQFDLVRDNANTGVWSFVGSTAGTQISLTDPSYA
ncbi:MAG TPA: SBBP repeat-containing protein, partial [Bacteroidia bacterium]|nr:SBBP repeat-containing protein [Bacteroidia bacterium]